MMMGRRPSRLLLGAILGLAPTLGVAAIAAGPASADVAFRAATAAANPTATTLTLTKPTNTTAGDVLIATVDARGNPTFTAPSGWTLVRADNNPTVQTKSTYVRVAGASEPSSWTWTLNSAQAASGAVLAYTGVNTTTPIDASAGHTSTDWDNDVQTAPSVTTSTANAVVLSLFGTSNASSATAGSGLTERADAASTAGTYFVDSEVADRVAATAGATPTTTATSNVNGNSLAQTVALRPAASPTGPIWMAPNSFWNVPIPASPAVDTHSSTMIDSLVSFRDRAHFVNDQAWGYPIVTATTSDPSYAMTSTEWSAGPEPVTCRVPTSADPNTGGDGHLTVIQPDGTTCDFWEFSRGAGGVPTAHTVAKSCGKVVGPNRDAWGTVPCRGTLGNAAVAAGFDLLGGILRPEEFDGTTPIQHALAISLPADMVRTGPAWPASHSDGTCTSTTGCIPEGAKLQLDPSVDVAALDLPAWEKKIAQALQTYGGYVSDQGGSFEIRAVDRYDDSVWTSRGIGITKFVPELPWEDMRVLQLTAAPSTLPTWWTGG
jgi:hypothetical protein